MPARPHVLAVDDGPFRKGQDDLVPLVAVLTEGRDLVEAIATGAFPVDGEGATGHLAEWIEALRFHRATQALLLGGITIAGLGVIDLTELADRLGVPALAVTRKNPRPSELRRALAAAGLSHRIAIVERSPPASRLGDGLFVAQAGATRAQVARLMEATLGKAKLPEPLRLAHLIGQAIVLGQSRGRA
jgi:hypothetical protein